MLVCKEKLKASRGVEMDIKEQCISAINELCDLAKLQTGDILVVGCSTSEVVGSKIGTNSNGGISPLCG